MLSLDSPRIGQMHTLLSSRESSHAYRMIHRYALARTPHCQGLTLFFQYLGLRNSHLLFNAATKAVKIFTSTRGVLLKGLDITGKAIRAPPIDIIRKGEKKIESLVEEGLSHFDFIENLWKKEELKGRLNTIIGYKEILFRT